MKKVFISYTWESEEHRLWVKELAGLLESDGLTVTIDQWDLNPGDELALYMEKAIRDSDYVLIICTTTYKVKANNRVGGSGYEAKLIASELSLNQHIKKFIPVCRAGKWEDVAPYFIKGNLYVNLDGSFDSESFVMNYADLLTTIYGVDRRRSIPKGNPREKIARKLGIDIEDVILENEYKPIKIKGIITEEVTMPKNDGTKGSALYAIPFRLSDRPDNNWKTAFIQNWKYPPTFTTMHRPGIARVAGDKIILDGTTIDEVRDVHRDTLIKVVDKTNEMCEKYEKDLYEQKKRQKAIERDHYLSINKSANEIKFD